MPWAISDDSRWLRMVRLRTHTRSAGAAPAFSDRRYPNLDLCKICIHGVYNVYTYILNCIYSVPLAAGTLEVKEGSHAAHDEFWHEVSTMSADEKAATGDWYLFKPEASPICHMLSWRTIVPCNRENRSDDATPALLRCLPASTMDDVARAMFWCHGKPAVGVALPPGLRPPNPKN